MFLSAKTLGNKSRDSVPLTPLNSASKPTAVSEQPENPSNEFSICETSSAFSLPFPIGLDSYLKV